MEMRKLKIEQLFVIVMDRVLIKIWRRQGIGGKNLQTRDMKKLNVI